ncbi:MAG: hypothetical protein IPG82_21895 [Saprospiraceae bacterium]|nr:hypothetical protein [Saprospiraceae bacterium]
MKILPFSILLTFISIGLIHCAGSKTNTKSEQPAMSTYEEYWQKVSEKEKEGLPLSGLGIVDSIYEKARAEGNGVQQIKALIYKAKYTSQLDEDGVVKGIELFENDLLVATDPVVKSLNHSLLAQLYSNYFQMHIWEIRDRTKMAGPTDESITTWSKEDFLGNIRTHYLESVKEPFLKTTPILAYLPILTEGNHTDSLRPFVYDILAHRAIDYFMNGQADADLVAESFLINDPLLFSHTDQFVTYPNNQSEDTISFGRQIISLFQDLERFHRHDPLPDAWVDVVKRRLKYMYDHFIGSEKTQLYESALNQWIQVFANTSYAAPFELSKAQLFETLGRQYQAGSQDSIYQQYLVKASALYQGILSKYKNTDEASLAKNQLNELLKPSLDGQVEKVNLPQKPFRILAGYQNVSKIFIKVIPISLELRSTILSDYRDNVLQQVLAVKSIRAFSQDVPGAEDMQSHKVEIKIDALPPGMYGLVLSNSESFKIGENMLSMMFTHVSQLAYLHSFNQYYNASKDSDFSKELVVVDRATGAPMAAVEATFYENNYNQSRQRNEWIEKSKASSDRDGKIIPSLSANKSFTVKLQKNNDYLWLDEAFSNSSYQPQPAQETLDALYFLDRSIYRPGQTIYFKLLALRRNPSGVPDILKNKHVVITLNDANGQLMSKQSFTTNDYGTINGSFVAPVNGLSGTMTLVSDLNYASTSFQVEEYKRPKFEITFDSNQVVNKFNQAITVTGQAKNYAGNAVDQAKVQYKITRARWYRPMPWWWGWKSYYPMRSNPQIISQGTTTTDGSGKFSIPFTAIPDPTVDLSEADVSFTYSVEIELTDFTGETRSSSISYRVGNTNLVLSTSLGQFESTDSLKEIKLIVTDLNESPIVAQGRLTIFKLKAPSTYYRPSYWAKPDQSIYSSEVFHQWFPTDEYKQENDVTTWKTESTVINADYVSNASIKLAKKLSPGIYKLEMSAKDNLNQSNKFEQYFWVNDEANGQFPVNQFMVAYQDKTMLEPGQQLNFKLRTQAPIKYLLQSSTSVLKCEWVQSFGLISEARSLTEKDRGTTHHIQWYTVYDNRVYHQNITYSMPWSNKELEFETISFRDKIVPGGNEEWSLKIKGKNKDKVVAEIVASMYDQSLDALYPHNWRTDLFFMNELPLYGYTATGFAAVGTQYMSQKNIAYEEIEYPVYRDLDWFGFDLYGRLYYTRGGVMMKSSRNAMPQADGVMLETAASPASPPNANDMNLEEVAAPKPDPTISVRKNLNETVFFYPSIKSDTEGNFVLKFKMNEALTRWRLMLFGHTPDLRNAYLEKEVITQKDLMVFPNGPRFLRQGDLMIFPAKVSNLSSAALSGVGRLELFDPMNGSNLNHRFSLEKDRVPFRMEAGQSYPLEWKITVPADYIGLLGYRIIAESGNTSDGEENVIPVLTNRMLVTETFPFQVRAQGQKAFVFKDMLAKMQSTTLQNHTFTLEGTSNPTWYAIQALPFVMEHQFECTEQIVNRYFANALGTKIVESNPTIKTVFDQWIKKDVLKSPLNKNEDLKTAVLAETPWVADAMHEEEQQKMIALLFDVNKMANEKNQAIQLLIEKQMSNGGFPWFEGRDDWYITQYIVETLGHLKKLGGLGHELDEVLQKAALYCDRELLKYYNEMRRLSKKDDIGLTEMAIHYLYARSFFTDLPFEDKTAFEYFLKQAEAKWLSQSLYGQGMIALAVNRWDATSSVPDKIVASLNEKAQHSDELGMYWKFDAGYRFFEMPIETQAMLIEAYAEVSKQGSAIDEMRLWLLKNKQTNRWHNTKATAAAIYSLLLFGDSWLEETKLPAITLDNKNIMIAKEQTTPGLGYFKINKSSSEITTGLANFKIENPNSQVMWGAAYWQYFEDIDKITSFRSTPLSIKKQIMVERVQNNKTVLMPATNLEVGDKVVMRMELKTDRPMDYIHLKDMRAAGLEPINVISQYKYQGGLGYYESTKDLATHFFFDHIVPGTYVFEYAMRVAQKGDFSNGISTLECMYAPEFSSHTSGATVSIK